jgi:urease accessory protein
VSGAPPRLGRCQVSLAIAVAIIPGVARAHLDSTGMGPLYDGVVHLLRSPEDLVADLAVALLAGLRGASQGRRALFVLPAAWFVGGLAGTAEAASAGSPVLSAAWFVVLGILVAADAPLPERTTTGLATLLGLQHGWLNGSGMDRAGAAAVALVGLTAAVFVLVAVAAALVVSLRPRWARIAVRVAGSWVAASGLLMLGWAFRSH